MDKEEKVYEITEIALFKYLTLACIAGIWMNAFTYYVMFWMLK